VEDIDDEEGTASAAPQVAETLRPYPDKVYEGARVLSMDVAFVNACREAINLVYGRDYTGV
jgi:hypothetical protein